MQVCTSLQTDNHASTPPQFFYRLDALPAPTNSIKALKADIKTEQNKTKHQAYKKTTASAAVSKCSPFLFRYRKLAL